MSDSGGRARRRATEANHVVDVAAGGSPAERHVRRSPNLRIIPDDWKPKPGVPASRADCPTKRPCEYIRCRHHLWLKLGMDRDGNPKRGKGPPSILWPMTPATCSLDVAARAARVGGKTMPEVGELLGVSDEMVRHIEQRALAKLRANPDAAELLEALKEVAIMRDKRRAALEAAGEQAL